MPQLKPICTDPSHPPIIGTLTQETLYKEVSELIANHPVPQPTHRVGGDGPVDTRLLGLTTQHVYFAGSHKKFRVRYDRIVSLAPYEDGFGIIWDAQAAKPQTFRIGDGWFGLQPGREPVPTLAPVKIQLPPLGCVSKIALQINLGRRFRSCLARPILAWEWPATQETRHKPLKPPMR